MKHDKKYLGSRFEVLIQRLFFLSSSRSLAMKHNKKYLGSRFVDIFRSDIPELINCCLHGGQGRAAASHKHADPLQSTSTAMRITGMPYGSTDEDVTTFFAGTRS